MKQERQTNVNVASVVGEGYENETGFGHNDFYCPKCCRESLVSQV